MKVVVLKLLFVKNMKKMQMYLYLSILFSIQLESSSLYIKDDTYPIYVNGNDLPEFIDSIPNVTVTIGREAKLPCSVQNLGGYKVAWMRVEDKTILTIHDHIITRNYRIGLSQSDNRQFNLHINDAKESDRGGYMCQINTVPMIYQVGFLDVVLPPDIITSETSSDVTERENTNTTLKCRAKGYPTPKIQWRREDNKPIEYGDWQEKKAKGIIPPDIYEGSTLNINKLSRTHMGAYLCIASNGVQPSVSKRIMLYVHFQPMVWVPNQLIGASLGSDALLICKSDASPEPTNYWTKDDQEAISPSCKYEIEREVEGTSYQMILRIKNIEPSDYGLYKCFSRNSLGLTAGSIKVYEIHGNFGERNGMQNNHHNAKSLNDGVLVPNESKNEPINQRNSAVTLNQAAANVMLMSSLILLIYI